MKLKGWKKLEKSIQKTVRQIDEEINLFISNEDECYTLRGLVGFGILRSMDSDERFMNNLRKNYPDAPVLPSFLYSLLHEIGHLRTVDALDQETIEQRESAMKSGDSNIYFQLPGEIEATAWAVQYAKDNFQLVVKIGHEIENAVRKFSKKNCSE